MLSVDRDIIQKLKRVSETPSLDFRLLKAYAEKEKLNLDDLIRRRLSNEPISKIIGKRGFWKSDFITTVDVLDPRPDSETMIETVLSFYPDQTEKLHILDIGTGSGCLLFSILDEYPNAQGVGIDKSQKALAVAEKNKGKRTATLYQRDFFISDWCRGLGYFDVIISNPPYIPSQDISLLSDDVQKYDPLMALDGGTDGLDAYRALSKSVGDLLIENGYLFLEIGIGQGADVQSLFENVGFNFVRSMSDLGQIERILVFQKQADSDK